MATIRQTTKRNPIEISRFLGINIDTTGDTQIELGESGDMQNFRITENYKLKKREGYRKLFDNIQGIVRGMWYGKLNGTYHFLFACNGNVYEHDMITGTNTSIGTLTDAKTVFFAFNDNVYILNGAEYKKWTGSGNIVDVEGYIPLIAVSTPPGGGGTLYEPVNLLTGKKRQQFSPDGSSTTFQLAETNIDRVDKVWVEGELQETSKYTVDKEKGIVTFAGLEKGFNTLEIQWTKGNGNRDAVLKCRAAMLFGGSNDTRVFIWGNPDTPNRTYYSELADGVPSAEYFPELYFNDVGSSEYAITDIVRQYDRQIIFKENEAWYSYYNLEYDELGDKLVSFPLYPLNSVKGNVAFNQSRVIQNNPYTLMEGVYEWISTNVRDERNAVYKSKRVQPDLDNIDLSKCITCDYEQKWEYWICHDNDVWIYNYRIDVWYRYKLGHKPTYFLVIDGDLYFGTQGTIMCFDDDRPTDEGITIDAYWEMNFYDFGAEWLRKYLNRIWISLKPEIKVSLDVEWETDRNINTTEIQTIEYNLFDYARLDYENWTYNTRYNPQPFRLKVKAKKFTYFKLILKNNSNMTSATVLSINLAARAGGESK